MPIYYKDIKLHFGFGEIISNSQLFTVANHTSVRLGVDILKTKPKVSTFEDVLSTETKKEYFSQFEILLDGDDSRISRASVSMGGMIFYINSIENDLITKISRIVADMFHVAKISGGLSFVTLAISSYAKHNSAIIPEFIVDGAGYAYKIESARKGHLNWRDYGNDYKISYKCELKYIPKKEESDEYDLFITTITSTANVFPLYYALPLIHQEHVSAESIEKHTLELITSSCDIIKSMTLLEE